MIFMKKDSLKNQSESFLNNYFRCESLFIKYFEANLGNIYKEGSFSKFKSTLQLFFSIKYPRDELYKEE